MNLRSGWVPAVVATTLLIIALALVAPRPLAAAGDIWKTALCYAGAITRAEPDATHTNVTIEGRLECAKPPGTVWPTYGLATFYEGLTYADLFWWRTYPYSLTAPTLFSVTGAVRDKSWSAAVCVATNYRVRVACITIRREAAGAPIVVQPIATTDPLVRKEVWFYKSAQSDPLCGTCW